MKVENFENLQTRIEELKRRKRAVILAHYYTTPEVQAVADFLGDSLALSVKAQDVDAEIIRYVNRLSDYLFVLSRAINHVTGTPERFWEN